MVSSLKPIECSSQPLSISFHPSKDIVAAGLVDGTVEIHDLIAKSSSSRSGGAAASAAVAKAKSSDDDDDGNDMLDDEDADTILASIYVAKEVSPSKLNTQMLAKLDQDTSSSKSGLVGKATQGPSCRCVLFSRSPHDNNNNFNSKETNNGINVHSGGGGEYLYTACNGGSIRCLDSELACNSLDHFHNPNSQSPILWSIENAHNMGISKLYQLPHSSPCGPALVTGDDVGTVRLWDTRMCGAGSNATKKSSSSSNNNNNNNNNPFDNLMKIPTGCIQHWKVNHDYMTDFVTNDDGSTLFASSADGTLSVFDIRFVNRKGTPRSVIQPDIDPHNPTSAVVRTEKQWEQSGYTQSDNQEDELLSMVLLKNSQKLLVGSQQGILSLFSYNQWADISDRFPGHPQSIDALLKIDEDTVLTGSSDGLVRAVQLLPNALLGVLGGHDGFPVEGLGWSAGRKMVGSVSHDEYIRLWDASLLNEDDGDDDDDEEEEMKMAAVSKSKEGMAVKSNSTCDDDDDWEDMDEDDDYGDKSEMDSDDSDSDDDSNEDGGKKSQKRDKIFKSENEEFFSDL
ncbi:hypothetical protein ACHAXH_008376 [Discostella pseudostelligera]